MDKIFFTLLILGVLIFTGVFIHNAQNKCLSSLANNIGSCTPYACELAKHPYASAKDRAKIYGYRKGKCAYVVHTGQVKTTCFFPKNMLKDVALELGQKSRAERFGPVTESRMGHRVDSKTGKEINIPEVLIHGEWEAFRHTLRDAVKSGICRAYNKDKKRYIRQ